MVFSYKKLWKMLIDKEMKKRELCAKAGISSATLAKMAKGESITTESLLKICVALDCDVQDIMEKVETLPKD
ncbi:MAG: helix-turn-helix transcriptional regulator [Clostridia bacterium]|nr:helix-turn-helix transcriptional regulator [Clostridia bacterium]